MLIKNLRKTEITSESFIYICRMKNLISHIEFLILEHEYVIIPDFGGFVLNKESAHIDVKGNISPPTLSLGFNSELRYNDGLLAESYMKRFSIPYDIACRQIEATVKRIKTQLASKQPVEFGRLGKITLSNGRILFEPSARTFSNHPYTWGMAPVELRPLTEVSVLNEGVSKRKVVFKYVASIAGTAAAAAIILFSPFPFNKNLIEKVQQSGFIFNEDTGGRRLDNKDAAVPKNELDISDTLHQRLKDAELKKGTSNEAPKKKQKL